MKNYLVKRSLVCGIILLLGVGGNHALSESKLNINNELVGYWSFDEGTGDIAHDASGNNNDGMIYNATWTKGILGFALNFDGHEDYVDFTSPILNTPPYTVCAWVKPSTIVPGVNRYIISNGGQTHRSYGFYLMLGYDYPEGSYGWVFGVARQDGDVRIDASTPAFNDWTFLCGTWDGSPDGVKLYVNANLKAVGVPEEWWTGTAQNLRIGAPSDRTYSYEFEGIIDEVRIYNRTLSEDEIIDIYEKPFKTYIFMGKIRNLNATPVNYITFEAEKLKIISFSPFRFFHYYSGEKIIVLDEYIGFLTPNVAFGVFRAVI